MFRGIIYASSMLQLSPNISVKQLTPDDAEELQPIALKAYKDHTAFMVR